jgi:hypothetical protein
MTKSGLPDSSKFNTNFSFQCLKNDRVTILMDNRPVTHLKGQDAVRFLSRVAGNNHDLQQLEMAKATGNFKRGNEKQSAKKPKSVHEQQQKD